MNGPRSMKSLSPSRLLPAAVLVLSALTVCAAFSSAQSAPPLLLRDPTISKTQIAFAYAGSVWTASRDGSGLRRITTGGHESKPIFSPDGSLIAFTGNYDGSRSVYVISANGGEPRRSAPSAGLPMASESSS